LWESIRKVNAYINTSEPWKIKENPELLHEVLYNCLYAIHCATYLLCPAMPNIAQKIYAYLGLKTSDLLKNPCLHFGQFVYRLSEPEILFVKFESE
jgi:methionyl-tRNA synthetase